MLRRSVKFLAVAALVMVPAVAQAQLVCAQQNACQLTPTATLTIPTLVRMAVPSLDVILDGSSILDMSAGTAVVPGAYGNVNVRANAGWNLQLYASQPNWDFNSAASTTRAATTLQVSVNTGAFTNIATGAGVGAQIASSASSTNGTDVAVAFQVTLPGDYSNPANAPGTYTLPLVFLLTAP